MLLDRARLREASAEQGLTAIVNDLVIGMNNGG